MSKSNRIIQFLPLLNDLLNFRFQVVYQGTTHTCKVSRLQELTSYRFRICAFNDAGQGAWSDVVQFCTAMAPPPPVKGVHFCDVTQTSCTIEWTPCRLHSCDPVLYHAHLSRVKTQEFRHVSEMLTTGPQRLFAALTK